MPVHEILGVLSRIHKHIRQGAITYKRDTRYCLLFAAWLLRSVAGTIKFIGLFDSAEECFGALNASTQGPFNSFTWNDATIPPPYGRHCWGDTSMIWQNRGGATGQTSGRGPGFPVAPWLPPNSSYTRDHLTGLRQVAYDPQINGLISNPVRCL